MLIGFDAKRYFHNHTGLGNYSRTLVHNLQMCCPEVSCNLYDEGSFLRTFRLGTKARRDKCDILHGLSNELPRDCSGITSIVTIHDVAWRAFPAMYSYADRFLYDWKYGWSARHADVVIAISESTKAELIKHYGIREERIRVIYQPVQDIFYTPVSPADARQLAEQAVRGLPKDYLLSVGSINSRKNLLNELKALAMIPAGQRMPLVVVGRGREYMKECRAYASAHLRQQDVIWVTDLRDNQTLQAVYRSAYALLYASHYEGFGLPVAEALLQGCPVLTSTTTSLPEAAGPGAVLVNPADVEAIADGICRLVDDSYLHRSLATAGECYCRQTFDPHRLTQQLISLYKQGKSM